MTSSQSHAVKGHICKLFFSSHTILNIIFKGKKVIGVYFNFIIEKMRFLNEGMILLVVALIFFSTVDREVNR